MVTTSAESFGKHCRLRRKEEFDVVFAEAKWRLRCRDTYLLLARRNGLAGARLGIIVQRRFIATAVARNRAKRRLRESFRRHRDQLPALDIVVLAYPELAQSDSGHVRRTLEEAWRKLATQFEATT